MKKSAFISLFIGAHVLCVFLQIYQYSRTIKASYQKQKSETALAHLKQKEQELTHQLYALQNKTKIKEFALNTLKMESIALGHIKKMPMHDHKSV
jgi:cell division protein FtsB